MTMNNEKIIVSLTTWKPRITNIPYVLDRIFEQTVPPDLVVLNLAEGEEVPDNIFQYLSRKNVEINFVPDTKVYKKIIPTLLKYPDDCIICIDDDWLYPPDMIEDLIRIHEKHPNNPISGNRELYNGYACHCGCASLVKASFLDLTLITKDIMNNCPSDDIVYTYLATKSGHPYLWSRNLYYTNMKPYNAASSYTVSDLEKDYVGISWNYLEKHYGVLDQPIDYYIPDLEVRQIVSCIMSRRESAANVAGRKEVTSKLPYKIGHFILSPFSFILKKIT